MVIARYDLRKTRQDLIIAISVPTILFIISFITLCFIMQFVRVGDDAKMRCKYCMVKENSDINEMITASSKYEVSSPESDDPSSSRNQNEITD